MADNIDNLSFGIILKDEDFKKKMNEVKGLAKTFSDDVAKALALTNALQSAQGKGGQGQEKKAKIQRDIVNLTRQELEAKKAAGNITDAELRRLKLIVQTDKAVSDEKKKQLDIEKKQLDIQDKQERMARRRGKAEGDTGRQIKLNSNALLQQSSIMKGLASMAAQYFSVFGAAAVVRNLVRITGEFEAQRVALRSILQDNVAADNIYNQLQVLAVKSPFTFQNLVGYAKQLTAFSVPVNEVYETTKKLADVSAGLGVDMGRIILAYGQVRSAEFLRGQEVRQFTEAGIPILKELADQFQEIEGHAISVGEVFDRISARQVPFAMVEEAFNRMVSAGGKFYQMQEVLAETVKGKVSNLQDAWEIMLSKIGDEKSGTIKGIVNTLTNLFANYEKWIGILGTIIKTVGIYGAGLAFVNTVTKAHNAVQLVTNGLHIVRNQQIKIWDALMSANIALQRLSIKNTEEEAVALAALNFARKAAVGAVSALIAIIWSSAQAIKRNNEEARKTTDTINAALSKLSVTMADFKIGTDKVEDAFVKMKNAEGDATEETRAFNKSVDDLKKQFPKFIDDHVRMAQTVDELGRYWAQARLEMNQYYADEARGRIDTDLKQTRDADLQTIEGKVGKWVRRNISGREWDTSGQYLVPNLVGYVRGDIDSENVSPFVDALGRLMFGEGRYNKDIAGYYREKIYRVLDSYKNAREDILTEFNNASEAADKAVSDSNLSTTRNVINAGITDRDLQMSANEDVGKYAQRLRDVYNSPETKENVKTAIADIFDEFPKILGELSHEPSAWAKDVNEIIRGFNAKSKGNTLIRELDETAVQDEVIERWKKDLDDVQASLAVIPLKYRNLENQTYVDLKARQSLLETLSQNLYGNKTFDGRTKVARDNTRDTIANLKQQFQDLKELKDAYDKFKSIGFDDARINELLNNYFGVGVPTGGFGSAFENIAVGLDKYGANNDAQDVRNFAAGKDWKAFYDSEKARMDAEAKDLEDYNKRIQGYIEDAKSIQQKIADLEKSRDEDLAKAATDEQRQGITAHYADEIDKLRESLVGLTSIQLTDFWQQLTGEKNGTYRNLTRLQEKAGELIEILKGVEPNRNKDGKITGYTLTQDNAGDFLKWMGVDAQSLQLSVAQVEALIKAFESLFGRRAEKNGMSALFDMIKKGGIKQFWKDVKDGSSPAIETLREASGQLSQIGSVFTELGEAAKSDFLVSFGKAMSFMGDVWSKFVDGDTIAAVGAFVKELSSSIAAAQELKRSIREAADEAERLNAETRLASGVDTIFGENMSAKVRNAISLMRDYSDVVAEDRGKAGSLVVWKTDLFGWGRERKSLDKMVAELGYDLYDSYGNLNAEALQAILDTYDSLTDKSREWLEDAIKDSEIYADAMKQLDDVVEGVFGNIVDDMTNTFIDNFLQMGYAVDDLGDTFTNLGDTILRSMIKSYVMDEILDKYGERAKGLIAKAMNGEASAEEVASELAGFADDVEAEIKASGDFIQQMIQAFYDRGLLNTEANGESDSLSGGIKGITEDTANLLASYLNAIRADVSYGKTQWERIAVAVEGHATQYITLNDYMMQVQANTANIAESNRRILDHIESVLTSEGGLPAIRTYS